MHDISYKTLLGSTTLHFRFNKIDGFIKIYDGISYLVSFSGGFHDEIYDRIK